MKRISILLPILSFCLVPGLSAKRTSTNYSIGPETFAGLAGDSNSSAYAQFSAVEPLSGLSVKNMPDFKNFAGFIGQLPPLDQDGDGLPDSQEAVLGTDKTLVDTDADGLTDGEEVFLGTNPLVADSDGDGYSDFAEAQASTNPLLASSNPNKAPSSLTLSNQTILENQPVGTVIGVITAQDTDANDTLTYQLITPPGQPNNQTPSPFTLETNGTLLSSLSFDFEQQYQFPVWIRAVDSHGSSIQKEFIIRVLDVDESTPTTSTPETPSDNNQSEPITPDPDDQNQSTEPDSYWPESVAKNVPLNEQNIRQIYLAMLGREPDLAGLAYWSQSGLSTNSFVSTLAESQEFKYRLANGLVNQPNEHEESSSENNQSVPTTPDPDDQNESTSDEHLAEIISTEVLAEVSASESLVIGFSTEGGEMGISVESSNEVTLMDQSDQNGGWSIIATSNPISTQYNETINSIQTSLPLGSYSLVVMGGGSPKTTSVKLTKTAGSAGKFKLFSTRALSTIGTPLTQNIEIAGNGSAKIFAYALGTQTLENFGISNSLNDPELQVFSRPASGGSWTPTASNDNWVDSPQASDLQSLSPTFDLQSRESGLIANLPKNAHSFQVRDTSYNWEGQTVLSIEFLGSSSEQIDDIITDPTLPPSPPADSNETGDPDSELVDHNTTTPVIPEIPGDDKPIIDPGSGLVDNDQNQTTEPVQPEPEVVLRAPNGQLLVDKLGGKYRHKSFNGIRGWSVLQTNGIWEIWTSYHDSYNSSLAQGAYDQLPENDLTHGNYEITPQGDYLWRSKLDPHLSYLYVIDSVDNGVIVTDYFIRSGLLDPIRLGKSHFFLSKEKAEAFLASVQPEPEPLPQVPTFELVENQVSENSPAGSFAGKLLVPDLNGTQTLSFILSEPSPFELKPNGTLLAKRSFDFESDPASLPLTITATNDSNQSLELNFAVTLLNEIEDLDGDGFEDAHDPDIDGDGLSNKDEALAGTDPRIEDSDEDELSDGEEIALKTNPLSDDSDQDGLTDGTEIGIGTNPLAKDTDGDGFNDQEEVLAGSFPEDANDYPGKQVVVERDPSEGPDGLLYQLSEEKFTLEEAINYAAQEEAVIPYLTVSTAHSEKDPLEIFLVQFMARNSSLKNPKAWILGETQDFFGFERKTILTQRGSRFTFTGNRKLQVLLGYEKPPVRIPYLKTLAAEIDGNKVRISGELMDDGGEKPFRSGFRISEKILVQENDPTTRIVSASLKDNILEAVVERLEPGTTYYLRAFAENSAGVSYGAFKRIKLTESYDAPFAGKPEGQGWFRSDWFGLFLPANENWVFHQDFEWIYHGPTNQNGIWFWSERIGWSWTREDVWPYLWMNNQSNWTYYFGKKGGQPTFWDYSNQSVFRWRNPVSWVGSNDSLPQ